MKDNYVNSLEGFYIGDPCYVLPKDAYRKWGKEYDWKCGLIEDIDFKMVVGNTSYGDGIYELIIKTTPENSTCRLGVDSGTIAVIPLEYCDKKEINGDYKYVLLGAGRMTLSCNDGIFVFSGVVGGFNATLTCNTQPIK